MEERPIRILLVEDDAGEAADLQETLEKSPGFHFELTQAGSLTEAVALAGRERFDLVLLDLSLPDSHGVATFMEFHAESPSTPTVVLTGLDDDTVSMAAVQGGAQDYLVKGEFLGHGEPAASMLALRLRYAIERQRNTDYLALITGRERFDAAVAEMSDGIVVTEGDWRIVTANRAACRLLDLPLEGWRGLALEERLAEFTLSEPLAALRTSDAAATSFEIARTDTRPPLYLDARLSRLYGGPGDLRSVVLTVRDVTDERLARGVRASFLSLVPHKLRTPLAILSGYLELTGRRPADRSPQQWERLLGACRQQLSRVSDIVEKLLDFEALSASQLVAELGQTCIAELAAVVGEELVRRYPERHVELTTDISPDACQVDCGADHVQFVLTEIMDNAVKFGDKDPVRIWVRGSVREAGRLTLAVADNGPGIPHEYLDRIFDGFVQVEEHVTGLVPGLGLGLSLVREVVGACGGQISVDSRLGEGSTFTLTVPASHRPSAEESAAPACPTPAPPLMD